MAFGFASKVTVTFAVIFALTSGAQSVKLEDHETYQACLADANSCTKLSLESAGLTGSIPSTIGLLTNLQTLTLYNNILNGTLPDEIGNMTQLETLNLHHNYISGSIPTTIGKMTSLKNIFLYVNRFSGQIPTEIGRLDKVISIFLSTARLTGTIPTEFGNMQQVVQFSLHNNRLTGSIPSQLGQLCNSYNECPIKAFYLSSNLLTGTVPAELEAVKDATKWSLCNNSLNGNGPMVDEEGNVNIGLEECESLTTSAANPVYRTSVLLFTILMALIALAV